MTPEDINLIRCVLPEKLSFPYYAGRETAWLMAQHMPEHAKISDLRKTGLSKLLDRPVMQPVIARCGGNLCRHDVLAVAHADRAMRFDGVGASGLAGVEAVYADTWHDFELSFDVWGEDRTFWDQTTRRQANLVLQLGFPSDHAALMGQYLRTDARQDFESGLHPVRTDGRPTLAWARLDIDLVSGEALIEEVQSDWLRFARADVARLRAHAPRSRALQNLEKYEASLMQRYGKLWPKALLLAVLHLLRDELVIRRVWMHQPEAGQALKRIYGTAPPRSLYTRLPQTFCFEATEKMPGFVKMPKGRVRKQMPKSGPLFWRMDFN